jgi:hypothetical protein
MAGDIYSRGESYDDQMPLLLAMFREFQDASKKKPDGVLNKQKVQITNRLLNSIFSILEGEPNRTFLDTLNEDDLPQNSDVVLMLGQAVAAMEAFQKKYYRRRKEGIGKSWQQIEYGTTE